MLSQILEGALPSSIFRKIIEENPSITNFEIAEMLGNEFIDLNSQAKEFVWHWKGPKRSQGLSDENLDALLLRLFKEAGYF